MGGDGCHFTAARGYSIFRFDEEKSSISQFAWLGFRVGMGRRGKPHAFTDWGDSQFHTRVTGKDFFDYVSATSVEPPTRSPAKHPHCAITRPITPQTATEPPIETPVDSRMQKNTGAKYKTGKHGRLQQSYT